MKWNPFTNTEKRRVYLDHAGATKMSARAVSKLTQSLSIFGNPSAIYAEGVDAKSLLAESKRSIAKILSAHPYELYFTGSGTESVTLAILGTISAWQTDNAGSLSLPHIITTEIEHPAVRELCLTLQKEGKASVTFLPLNDKGLIRGEEVKAALTDETVLVTIMYVNNEIGTIMPIKEIGRMLAHYKEEKKSNYPYFHTDACQAANYLPLDVLSLRADLMTLNAAKIYGPKGIGLLYKKEKVKIKPVILGGGQERGLRSGTESVYLASSFSEALTETLEMRDKETERLLALRQVLVKGLTEKVPGVVLYGTFEEGKRIPNNVNFRVPGIESDEMILRLDALGFSVSHKSACASEDESGSYVLRALGATEKEASENIRVTLGRETTKEDIGRFIQTVAEIASKYAKRM